MNKAAFLNIVRQVAPIQDQEVDDLEKLVVSFPYCQTAHVLLAKAAHDRGSMLSTQKLRRAAAHASNRQLLKQLIYAAPPVPEVYLEEQEEEEQSSAPTAVSEPFSENQPQTEVLPQEEEMGDEWAPEETEVEEVPDTDLAGLDFGEDLSAPKEQDAEEETDFTLQETSLSEEAELSSEEVISDPQELAQALLAADTFTSEEEIIASDLEEEALFNTEVESLPEQEQLAATFLEPFSEKEVENSVLVVETGEPTTEQELQEEEAILEDFTAVEEEDDFNLEELLELIQINGLSSLSAPIPSVNLTHEEIISEITSSSETASLKELPEPADEARELPLAAVATDDNLSAYLEIAELYTVYDTSGYEFPTLKVQEAEPASVEPETEQDLYLSIFTQNNLAYWMGSSRLGESIQLKDELTSLTPFYFQPELILEHVKSSHTPAPEPEETPAAKLDKQLFIINQFLKSAPKRKNVANAQLPQEPQEDLSAKSSKPKKNLVSENLALIFIKQGKAKKAIKIYEQLIVKFPEKKSYFAEQIEKLRNEL
ncbi:tetratricopeptide repeat protein [Rufibacter radiotolerans]|nr:tetratricopeptide repeat protein [Rufibacter radiotolerans]